MRYTPNGRARDAVQCRGRQAPRTQQTGEWIEETDWFRVSVWGDRAERMAEGLPRKGNKVFVEGRFKTREFGRGGRRTSLEITADGIVNLERRPREEDGGFGGQSGQGYVVGRCVPAASPTASPNRATSTTFPDLTKASNPMPPARSRKRDFYRDRRRRKVCAFCATDKTVVIDYKEVNRLRRYLSERKIEPRRKTGTCAGHQRELAVALSARASPRQLPRRLHLRP